jgi:hypothetical protein
MDVQNSVYSRKTTWYFSEGNDLYENGRYSSALREPHRRRLPENRALRRTFGAKVNKVTAAWKKTAQ